MTVDLLQWGRDLAVTETYGSAHGLRQDCSFNGAVTLRSRKRGRVAQSERVRFASMGP